jgi:hypothetical protein
MGHISCWSVYGDNVNLLGDNKCTIKKHTYITDASKWVGLEVHTEKTKYMTAVLPAECRAKS